MIDFAVIDFEYPEAKPEKAYKVCLLVVMNGHIIQEFQSYFSLSDFLDSDMPIDIKNKCEVAPPFGLIERVIGDMVLNLPIVSCNSEAVKKIFELEHKRIKLPIPHAIENIINPCDTLGLSFEEICKKSGIDVPEQGSLIDKVFDCALLYTKINGKELTM